MLWSVTYVLSRYNPCPYATKMGCVELGLWLGWGGYGYAGMYACQYTGCMHICTCLLTYLGVFMYAQCTYIYADVFMQNIHIGTPREHPGKAHIYVMCVTHCFICVWEVYQISNN
jgi:hypothetical protein